MYEFYAIAANAYCDGIDIAMAPKLSLTGWVMIKKHQYSLTLKPIASRFLVGVLAGVVSLTTLGETVPSLSLTMQNAVSLTLENHPDLRVFVDQQAVMEGRRIQADTEQRAQVSLMIEDAMGTDNFSALKSMQSTLTYSWILQQEQISSRIKAVDSEASQLLNDKKVKALDLSALTAKKFIEVLVSEEQLRLNKLGVSQARELLSVIKERINAGKSSLVERKLAEAELIRRELAVEDSEHEIAAAKYQLSALWGDPETDYSLSGDLSEIPMLPNTAQAISSIRNNPQVSRFTTSQRIVESQIENARIEAKPQWQLSAGVRRYESTDDFGLVAGVSIPWGRTDINAGKIAALRAQQQVLASEQASLMQQLDAQLFVLIQEMAHSGHVIHTIENRIIPTLDSALKEARHAFEKGQLSYTQWVQLQRELLNTQRQLVASYEAMHLQHIEIQRLTGTAFSQ